MRKLLLYTAYAAVLLTLLYFDKVINLVMSAICRISAPIECSGIILFAIGIAIIFLIE